jgi:hypothetical protein
MQIEQATIRPLGQVTTAVDCGAALTQLAAEIEADFIRADIQETWARKAQADFAAGDLQEAKWAWLEGAFAWLEA